MHPVLMDAAAARGTGFRYWLIVLLLAAFGLLTIFSVGLYFWFMAAALILLSPFRSRPRIFFSGIAVIAGFLIGYVLIAPWGCQQSFTGNPTTGEGTVSPVVCTSPIGIQYSGQEPFEPTLLPALAAGAALALVAGTVTWRETTRNRSEPSESTG